MNAIYHPVWSKALCLVLCVVAAACAPAPASSNPDLILLSTTTTRDTGLLDVLVPDFQKRTGYNVKTVIAGSGEILKLGERGEGDVLLTHSPAAEETWMAAGHGTMRALVMHNDFVLVGPSEDLAGVKGLRVADALRRIADRRALFVSRGDHSGTNVKELSLWSAIGANPKGQTWYQETGAGQGLTLNVASEKKGYALTDRGTYVALRKNLALDILVERQPDLLNIYHVMLVNPAKSQKINAAGAKAFADYVVSPDAQAIIRTYGEAQFGQALFVPDAGKTEEQVLAGR
jgi:tungstate transport system substrate-binding protein